MQEQPTTQVPSARTPVSPNTVQPGTEETVPPTPEQTEEVVPPVSFHHLFLGGAALALFTIFLSIFFLRFSAVQIKQVAKSPETSPTLSITQSPTIATPSLAPQYSLSRVPGWQLYTDDTYHFAFQYPPEYHLDKGGKGVHELERVSLFDTTHEDALFNLVVWDAPSNPLQPTDVENWCFKTLRDEARKEKMLCAFLSAAAINSTDIGGYPAYTVNYYNSAQEKVDFYIIPLPDKVITIHVVTFLDASHLDSGESKASQILKTVMLL